MNAGEKGDELAEFVCQTILKYQDEYRDLVGTQIMVSRVVKLLIARGLYTPPKRTATPRQAPMSDMQVRAFRDTTIPFGKYAGHRVDDVSLSYLCNLTDPNPWINEVRRYLANPVLQQAMEDEPT